jgi:hypothetical protein
MNSSRQQEVKYDICYEPVLIRVRDWVQKECLKEKYFPRSNQTGSTEYFISCGFSDSGHRPEALNTTTPPRDRAHSTIVSSVHQDGVTACIFWIRMFRRDRGEDLRSGHIDLKRGLIAQSAASGSRSGPD